MRSWIKRLRKIFPAGIVAAGILLACYPWISNFVNERQADSIVQTCEKNARSTSSEEMEKERKKAEVYNRSIRQARVKITDPFKATLRDNRPAYTYESLLNADKSGVMGWIRIPSIGVRLPVYHGTSDRVLQKGVGHVPGTSLPVGGKSTHCVLTGHTGLTRARLFTDLTKMKEGDLFFLYVCGKTLVYRTNRIYVIKPEEVESLEVEEGKDKVTLLTCYPYGINTHRLCVQGTRIRYRGQDTKLKDQNPADSAWMREYARALFMGLGAAAGIILVQKRFERYRHEKNSNAAAGDSGSRRKNWFENNYPSEGKEVSAEHSGNRKADRAEASGMQAEILQGSEDEKG